MAKLVEMRVKRSRPGQLSDRGFDYGEEMLRKILTTRDELLNWDDFQTLFCPWLPAGTYGEVVYFLPFAFQFLLERRVGVEEITRHVFEWVSKNADLLREDDLWDAARENIIACLDHWTGDFDVVQSPQGKHRNSLYGTCYVKNSALVTSSLCELFRCERLRDLVPRFLRSLTFLSNDKFRVAWLLELSRSVPQEFKIDPSWRRSGIPTEIAAILNDKATRSRAASVVLREFVSLPGQAVYWEETFEVLGMA